MSNLAPGSYLVASHGTADHAPAALRERIVGSMRYGSIYPRTRAEFSRFFDGLELVEPGVVSTPDWRSADGPRLTPFEASAWCAVGRAG